MCVGKKIKWFKENIFLINTAPVYKNVPSLTHTKTGSFHNHTSDYSKATTLFESS